MSELSFSPLIVGCMNLGEWGSNYNTDDLYQFVLHCLSRGLTSFDHADIYGDYTTEAQFGKLLKKHPNLRSQMQLITKCGIRRVCTNRSEHRVKSYDASAKHIRTSLENSLVQLETDYVDLLLIHRPDWLLDPQEVAQEVAALKKEGKIKEFGVSNFTPSQYNLLNGSTPLLTNQIEASLLHLDPYTDGTLDQCVQLKARPMAWSPLGAGKFFTDRGNDRVARIVTALAPLCEKYSATEDQLLLAWLMRHPARILPVLGTTKIERIDSAVESLKIKMDREDWYDLWQASTGSTIA